MSASKLLVDAPVQATRWLGSCWRCRCWKMMMSWHTRRLRLRQPYRERLTADLAGCVYSPVTCWNGRKCCHRYVHIYCFHSRQRKFFLPPVCTAWCQDVLITSQTTVVYDSWMNEWFISYCSYNLDWNRNTIYKHRTKCPIKSTNAMISQFIII